ncbi:MAG: YadA C-terminal domain-containing protein [Sphingopyxis sp.]|uniref:hypothetical protein n=1 Tax=Sphingopyxis sp. TaxID=1908224 RepID=UPI001A19A8EF|nr:hypothetical protein [Sphingopyxis sp.]MBJ7501814.1 YadA C-terminal domain-containing protein [Sphingopyxis sp.]
MIIDFRRTIRASLFAMSFTAASIPVLAEAQLDIPTAPMGDVDCVRQGSAADTIPPCTNIGTRTVTPVGPVTVEPSPIYPGYSVVNGTFDVSYDGLLKVEGRPYLPTTAEAADPNIYFQDGTQSADVTTTYRGELIDRTTSATPPAGNEWSYFDEYSDFSTVVRSINVDLESSGANGLDRSYHLRSVDPANIVNGNSTAVAGGYRMTGGEGRTNAIVFGRLTGTATLVSDPGLIGIPGRSDQFVAPFGLQYDVEAVDTTRLDENGLITPRVEVSEGIEMNGSRITGLGAAVAPGDAVNKAQLDAEAAVRQQVDLQISQRLAVQEASTTNLTTSLANEMSSRLAADNALAQRIDTVSTRLDQLESRMTILDDRISSSAAVASALSGNAFLPDMRFNLTANVATYDGAHAGSIQMGVLLNPHVALNAGVASGFNRRGKTAARAGMTVGF